MKVLLISQDFYPLKGGIATYLMQIYKNYFSKEIFKVLISKDISKNSKLNKIDFEIKRLGFFSFIPPSKRKKKNKDFLNYMKKFKPDIVLFGYIRAHPEIMEEYKKINPNVKYGVVLHAKEVFFDSAIRKKTNKNGIQKGYTQKESFEYKQILNTADFLICVSQFTKELIRKQGIENKRLFVINPVLNKIPLNLKQKEHNNFILLSVGRLIKRKNHLLILKSLKELKRSIPKLKYKIIGNGPEEDRLKNFVKKQGIEDIVSFMGEADENTLEKSYSNCDIFVLPTKFIYPNDIEGFGIVFIEANSFGKPVIGGRTGGVTEAVEEGKSGLLINPNSKKELIDKILFLYRNEKISKTLGEYGRRRVIKGFYKKKNKKFIGFLEKIRQQ